MTTTSLDFAFSSASNEWFTPEPILVFARWLMGSIDLDPASCAEANERVKADVYYGLDNQKDGLKESWNATNVFCNPPYGRGQQNAFVQKMLQEFALNHFERGLLLVNASTSEKWFQPLFDYPICFLTGRLQFVVPETLRNKKTSNSTKSSALVCFSRDTQDLAMVYAEACRVFRLGRVMCSVS